MKLTVKKDPSLAETEVIVKYPQSSPDLDGLVRCIRQYDCSFQAKLEDRICLISARDVLYMDSADGKTFLYTKDRVYGLDSSLAELEAKLDGAGFVRISKNCILNISSLQSVRPYWNHRLEAVLMNGEKLIVTRHYIEELKEKIEVEI